MSTIDNMKKKFIVGAIVVGSLLVPIIVTIIVLVLRTPSDVGTMPPSTTTMDTTTEAPNNGNGGTNECPSGESCRSDDNPCEDGFVESCRVDDGCEEGGLEISDVPSSKGFLAGTYIRAPNLYNGRPYYMKVVNGRPDYRDGDGFLFWSGSSLSQNRPNTWKLVPFESLANDTAWGYTEPSDPSAPLPTDSSLEWFIGGLTGVTKLNIQCADVDVLA